MIWRKEKRFQLLQSTVFMLIPFFFLISSFAGLFCAPIDHLRIFGMQLHQSCLDVVPNSAYRSEYQTLLCGIHLPSERELLQNSGLIHWLLTYGFQIYLVDAFSKWLFLKQSSRNLFCLTFIPFVLMITAFHPSSVRATLGLFLRQFSYQRKFFWSPLQVAVFSGFLAVSLEPALIQSHSLFISWSAAIAFGFFHKSKIWIKMIAVALILLPLFSGMPLAHPLLNFVFALLSRPALFILFPLCLLGCFELHALEFGHFIFANFFWMAQKATDIFWPIELNIQFSVLQLWSYLLSMMILFLFFENKKLSELK